MRMSKDVRALNPELAEPEVKQALAPLDRANDLQEYIRVHAPGLAPVLTRDLPWRTFKLDLASEALRICVEVDGGLMRAGGGKHATTRDKQKIRELVIDGWAVLIFASTEVHRDPLGCIADIWRLVEARLGKLRPGVALGVESVAQALQAVGAIEDSKAA